MPRPRLQRAATARREKVQLRIREQSSNGPVLLPPVGKGSDEGIVREHVGLDPAPAYLLCVSYMGMYACIHTHIYIQVVVKCTIRLSVRNQPKIHEANRRPKGRHPLFCFISFIGIYYPLTDSLIVHY